jgi:hypothetical protein
MRRKRAMNAGNAAVRARTAAMTRANGLRRQIYLAALFNSLVRPPIKKSPKRK